MYGRRIRFPADIEEASCAIGRGLLSLVGEHIDGRERAFIFSSFVFAGQFLQYRTDSFEGIG